MYQKFYVPPSRVENYMSDESAQQLYHMCIQNSVLWNNVPSIHIDNQIATKIITMA